MALPLIPLPFLPIDARESADNKLAYGETVLTVNGVVFANIFAFAGNEKTITIDGFTTETLRALRLFLTRPEYITDVNTLLKALNAASRLGLQDLPSLVKTARGVPAILPSREGQALNWILRHQGGWHPLAPLFRLADYCWLKDNKFCHDVPMESLFSRRLTPKHLQTWVTELKKLHPVIARMGKLLDRQNYIAGGALIEAAIASGLLKRKDKKADTKYDIDIFCNHPADDFVRQLMKLLDDHQPYAFCRSSGVTIVTRDLLSIQITTLVNNDFDRAVGDFDLDCCQIGYYDKEIQMTPAAFEVIESGWQETLRRPVAADRVIKYQERGIKLEVHDAELITPALKQEYFEWQADSYSLLKKMKAYHSDFKVLSYPLACPREDWLKDYAKVMPSSMRDHLSIVHYKDAEVWCPTSICVVKDGGESKYLRTDDETPFTIVVRIKQGRGNSLEVTDSEVGQDLQERSEGMKERYLSCKGSTFEGQKVKLNAWDFLKFKPQVFDPKTIDETEKYSLTLQHHVSYYTMEGKGKGKGSISFLYRCLSVLPSS